MQPKDLMCKVKLSKSFIFDCRLQCYVQLIVLLLICLFIFLLCKMDLATIAAGKIKKVVFISWPRKNYLIAKTIYWDTSNPVLVLVVVQPDCKLNDSDNNS